MREVKIKKVWQLKSGDCFKFAGRILKVIQTEPTEQFLDRARIIGSIDDASIEITLRRDTEVQII